MKKFVLGLAGLALVGAVPAFADNTDTQTVTVSGTIVAALTASVTQNLVMPHLVKPSGLEPNTTVSVACGGTNATNFVTYTANGNPFANGTAAAAAPAVASANYGAQPTAAHTGTCANLAVTGEANYFFAVTTGTVTNPSANVSITATQCYSAGSAIIAPLNALLDGVGNANIQCGATVSANASAASYAGVAGTGSFDVTVTYD